MGILGVLLLLLGAVVLGFAGQAIGQRHSGYEWLIVGIGALVGGFASSVVIGSAGWFAIDGLAVVPALIGALVLGAIVELAYRTTTSAAQPAHH